MTEPTSPPSTASSPTATAPGTPMTVPQEQLDRYAELALHVMRLRNWVELHRADLPAALVGRWDAWHRSLGEVFRRGQTDQIALRQALAEVPTYRAQLSQYREAFASHGGPSLSVNSGPRSEESEMDRLKPLLLGGGGLALGLVMGFFVAGSRS